MSEDPFAFQVDRLTRRHHDRHDPSTVAEVTLRRWLTLRHRYGDPFDADLFDHIDAALGRMPPSRDVPAPLATGQASTPRIGRTRSQGGRSSDRRPVSRSA